MAAGRGKLDGYRTYIPSRLMQLGIKSSAFEGILKPNFGSTASVVCPIRSIRHMIDSACKKCRRAGEKLFLKGDRCFGAKCAMVKRPNPPGVHSTSRKRRRALSEYGRQLAEKQRIKRIYGIRESQFKNYVVLSVSARGDTRENLMRMLETRLDNVVFRLGWAKSRALSRQLVSHGHILINGKRVNIPSYKVRKDEVVALGQRIRKSNLVKDLPELLKKYEAPSWLSLDKEKIEAKVQGLPTADELDDLSKGGMIIEFYSR